MTRNRNLALSAFALAGALGLAGCSELPTAPVTNLNAQPTSLQGPAVASSNHPQLGRDPLPPDPDVNPDQVPAGSPAQPPAPPTQATATAVIRGQFGGCVRAGAFKVVVPPGAWTGNGIVTVRQPDVTVPAAVLTITPSTKNRFKVPVLVIVDASSLTDAQLASAQLLVLDPKSGTYSPAPGSQVSAAQHNVQAPVSALGSYKLASN